MSHAQPRALAGRYRAVVLDLFGTLVDAPTPADRRDAADELAGALEVSPVRAETVLVRSWAARHDGRIATVPALVAGLARSLDRPVPPAGTLDELLVARAATRLRADPVVLDTLRGIRAAGLRVGVLSDAAADVAAAWPDSPLAGCVDSAVFSCRAGAVKPEPALYRAVSGALNVPAADTLYCGDGGGDELRGAAAAGMRPLRVRRRGGDGTLAFGAVPWPGPALRRIEDLATVLRTGSVGC